MEYYTTTGVRLQVFRFSGFRLLDRTLLIFFFPLTWILILMSRDFFGRGV